MPSSEGREEVWRPFPCAQAWRLPGIWPDKISVTDALLSRPGLTSSRGRRLVLRAGAALRVERGGGVSTAGGREIQAPLGDQLLTSRGQVGAFEVDMGRAGLKQVIEASLEP